MKFIQEFLIRIEGEQGTPAVQFREPGTVALELASLHATQFFADHVERELQTNLINRKVSVIPIPVDNTGEQVQ